MKVSILGPTNMKKFSKIICTPITEIEKNATEIGKILTENQCEVIVISNYSGMQKLVGDSYKKHGGKLTMIYTENDYDWFTDIYMDGLKEADIKIKMPSWHDALLKLVNGSDIVIFSGLSAAVLQSLHT
jgi:hypothetical protein